MKRKLINLLIAIILIATCACAFTACDDGSNGTPTPPTEEQWETAIAFNYNRFQFVVTSGEASMAYNIDGDIVYGKEQYAGQPTTETYLAKVGENYFKYEKIETDSVWQRLPMSQAEYTEMMKEYKVTEFKNMFNYESFTFDSGVNALVAESVGMFTDVKVYFNNGKITKMTYETSDEWTINFTYNDTALNVPTNIITVNSDVWNGAFNFADTDYSYTLKVGEETTTVTVDGDNVRHQKTVGETTTITTAYKDGDSYYTLAPYTGWKAYAHPVYAWEDYYAKTIVTAQNVASLKDACANYLPSFVYSDFTFNSANNNFTATLIQIDGIEYSDVIVTFDDFNKLEKVEYVLIKDSNSINVSIEFNFSDMTISKPDNIITYAYPVPEEYESSFSLTADNYIGIYEDYTNFGYLKPNRVKIEKVGNKICLSEMTYNDDDFTKITYYDKDGDNYYKFAKVNDVWYKIRITEKAYNEIVNKMLNTVLIYNGDYAFEHLSQGANNYSIPGGGDEFMLNIFHVDYKVDRIVAGGMYKDETKYPKMQFFFDYGTASVTIPESQTAPYEIQLSEDWKTFFYRENYMDFTATIVSGDGKTSIYQSDYTDGTQTVYINVNAYSDSFQKAMQKTVTGNYTYKEKKSYGWTTSTATVNSRDEELKAQFESYLNFTFICPDFSEHFSRFTYNEDKGVFEFNGSQTLTLNVNGIFGYKTFSLKYASIEFDFDNRLSEVVIETNASTPKKYTITFSEYGSTSTSLPS